MRNISFSLTTAQFIAGTKTVTRRLGWYNLKKGDRLCAVEKGQGLKKGEKINRLGEIEILKVTFEQLCDITQDDCVREGFPEMTPTQFIYMFTKMNRCYSTELVTRIEFRKL